MKRIFACFLLLMFPALLAAQNYAQQQGTIIRMRMTDCINAEHRFMAAMSGTGKVQPGAPCPEYVLMTEKVVYVISGRSADPLIPLAETTRFHMQKNELLIRVDDASKESHFHIKAMLLRPDWDRAQMLGEAEATALIDRHLSVVDGDEPQR